MFVNTCFQPLGVLWQICSFTFRNSSCGKVMFSEASVSHSVHREVRVSLIPCPFRGYGRVIYGPISRRGVCIWGPGGRVSGRGWVFGDGYTLSPAPPENHKSGRYASYWNVFLLFSPNGAEPEKHYHHCDRTEPGYLWWRLADVQLLNESRTRHSIRAVHSSFCALTGTVNEFTEFSEFNKSNDT